MANIVRDSEGVYTFAGKRAFIRSDKESLIIRVGGGFMCLEEFLEGEAEKIIARRRNALSKSSSSFQMS